MAMLKLNIADGRRLIIPAQTVKAIRGATDKLRALHAEARSTVFYLMGGQVRSAGLRETVAGLKGMIDKDKASEAEWIEVETVDEQPFFMQLGDIRGVTGLDPESPPPGEPEDAAGCSLKIDLELAPGVSLVVYANGDVDTIATALEPDEPTPAPKAGRRRRAR